VRKGAFSGQKVGESAASEWGGEEVAAPSEKGKKTARTSGLELKGKTAPSAMGLNSESKKLEREQSMSLKKEMRGAGIVGDPLLYRARKKGDLTQKKKWGERWDRLPLWGRGGKGMHGTRKCWVEKVDDEAMWGGGGGVAA